MINLLNVSKTYSDNNTRAVDNITIKINSGKIYGFLGPNGAGKSTTIKMLTGILFPDTGQITINSIDIAKNPVGAKKIIGYVPDEPSLYEKMSGSEFLSFIADIFEMNKTQRTEAEDIAGEFGIHKKLADPISSFSRGMKQKLSITAALMHKPEIFILDEPMTGLDPQSAYALKTRMRSLCKQGKTVFFSTHVMEVAEKICDEVIIINHGKIITSGDLESIRNSYKSSDNLNQNTLEKVFLELTEEAEK